MNREELIDNYIMGRMSADEKASFEQMMRSDHQLQADVQLMQNSRLAVRSVALKEMFEKKEHDIRRRGVAVKCFVMLLLAASLVLGLSLYFMADNDVPSAEEPSPVVVPADTVCPVTEPEVDSPSAGPSAEPSKADSHQTVDAVPLDSNPSPSPETEVTIERVEHEISQTDFDVQQSEMLLWSQAAEAIESQNWPLAKSLLRRVIEADGPHKQPAQELLAKIELNVP